MKRGVLVNLMFSYSCTSCSAECDLVYGPAFHQICDLVVRTIQLRRRGIYHRNQAIKCPWWIGWNHLYYFFAM